MQLSRVQPNIRHDVAITTLLWSGLAAAVLWLLARPGVLAQQGLALAIALLTLFVAAIVASFSLRYMRTDLKAPRFFKLLGALVAAVLAFLFTGNLLVLAIAWCASGWLLAALVGHCSNWIEAGAAARRARLAFAAGDAALLAALGMLAWQAGTLRIDAALIGAASMPAPIAAIIALLLVIAASVRCALPPFSSWLLSSMTAPTPVSALMHAGLVNAGGFLLIRLAPVLEAAPAARMSAVALGLFGAIYGIGVMMVRPDVKRSLAGSTVSQMGFMVMSCGLGAYGAALWHIIAHGLFKAWLFLGSNSSIGMKEGKASPLSQGAQIAIAAGTVAVALAILAFGKGDANFVPLLLGLATAAATLAALLSGKVSLRSKLTLLLAVSALIVFHAAGLAFAQMAARADGPSLVPGWALLVLLIAFLGAWVWQHQRLSSGSGLPLRLYVHLINAGALPVACKGDTK